MRYLALAALLVIGCVTADNHAPGDTSLDVTPPDQRGDVDAGTPDTGAMTVDAGPPMVCPTLGPYYGYDLTMCTPTTAVCTWSAISGPPPGCPQCQTSGAVQPGCFLKMANGSLDVLCVASCQ